MGFVINVCYDGCLCLAFDGHFAQVCDGFEDCPFGEDEDSEEWFVSQDIINNTVTQDYILKQFKYWVRKYLEVTGNSVNGEESVETKGRQICKRRQAQNFFRHNIIISAIICGILLLAAFFLVNMFQNIMVITNIFLDSSQKGPNCLVSGDEEAQKRQTEHGLGVYAEKV